MKPEQNRSLPDDDDLPQTADEQAADWVARKGRGLKRDEQAELERWLAADARHAPLLEELEQTWAALDDLKDARLPDGRRLDHDLPLDDDALQRERRSRRIYALAIPVAAAAAIALGFFFLSARPKAIEADFACHEATNVGGLRWMELPDGSSIRLNTDTAVEVRYGAAERRVYLLRGEAGFTVAKDTARPFVVHARGVRVRAVGTAFDVRLRPETFEVLVTEGKVRVASARGDSLLPVVAPADEPPVLTAGHRLVVNLQTAVDAAAPIAVVGSGRVVNVLPEEIHRDLAWQERKLEFDSTRLDEIVAEFNRYSRHKLVIADPRLASRRFGGSFSSENADALVRLLERQFGVKAERRADETILRLTP